MESGSSRENDGKWVIPNGKWFVAGAPVILVSIGYIDPGKWASCIETGARFGGDLLPFMLLFNFVAILCYYLSAQIGVITGRSLAQICSSEYDKPTCFFLWIQAELSVICVDLTMILGIAHGLSMILGADLFTSVLLTTLNAVLFPLYSTLLGSSKGKFVVVCVAGLTLFCYVFGMLISLPEFPVSSNGFLSKLGTESVFALMSLLGANVMPHNFYLYSSIVQRYQSPAVGASKGVWFYDNLIVTISICSGIFLVNYVLMSSAANVFYSTGIGLLTLHDSMSLLDQVYKNPIMPFASFVILFLANQITAISWEICAEDGEKTVLHGIFNMDLPEWLHRATVRIFSVVPALYCLWHSGAEGMYHMLLCTQVMVALLIPSSVIPLFRVASSRPIMGVHKISPTLDFVVLATFMGMLGLEIIFVVEMIFGESDWVGNLHWNMSNATSVAYVVLLVNACFSLCFMLWLAATPLKSSSARLKSQSWGCDSRQVLHGSYIRKEENDVLETTHEDERHSKQETLPSQETSFDSHASVATTNSDINLPESIMDNIQDHHISSVEGDSTVNMSSSTSKCLPDPVKSGASIDRASDVQSLAFSPIKSEAGEPVKKTVRIDGGLSVGKDFEDGDTWVPEHSSTDVLGVGSSPMPEGPGSFRSLSGKVGDEGGSGAGSLSRLSGLGRAARRQFAVVLDEFWGQLYDFHGQITHEARSKKLDQLLGMDSKSSQSLTKADSTQKDFGMKFQSSGGRVSNNPMNLGAYDAPSQQKLQNNIESAYRAQQGSVPSWSNQMQLLDAYVQNSNRNTLDSSERRYQSLRLPPSSEALDYQPATIHGYQFASYLNRMAKDRSDFMNGNPLDPLPQKPPSLASNNYMDSLAYALGKKSANEYNSVKSSNFQNFAVQRNHMPQADTPNYGMLSAGPVEDNVNLNNAKKYHSLPHISAHAVPHRDMYLPDKGTQLDIPNTSRGYGTSVGRPTYDPSYSSMGSRAVGPLAFDELSPSRAYSMRLSSGSSTGSLWSRQPYEQFGVANKTLYPGSGNKPTLMAREPLLATDIESKLLQSLRLSILKLLKLEGSEWLFKSNDGADEDLIERVAKREKFFFEVESQDSKQALHLGESQCSYSERNSAASIKGSDEAAYANLVSSVPHCGEGCVWKVDLVVSFGVWCIRRFLDLSLMESRPELWGKYTYVLNRLQGIIDLGFFKPRTPMSPCFCLQVPASYQMRSSPPAGNGMLPPTSKPARGKVTTATMLLDTIKDVEISISCRKGRSGTAAGDVAFPKGKENLASVLKRYKRRLSSKPQGTQDSSPGLCKPQLQASSLYG